MRLVVRFVFFLAENFLRCQESLYQKINTQYNSLNPFVNSKEPTKLYLKKQVTQQTFTREMRSPFQLGSNINSLPCENKVQRM